MSLCRDTAIAIAQPTDLLLFLANQQPCILEVTKQYRAKVGHTIEYLLKGAAEREDMAECSAIDNDTIGKASSRGDLQVRSSDLHDMISIYLAIVADCANALAFQSMSKEATGLCEMWVQACVKGSSQ